MCGVSVWVCALEASGLAATTHGTPQNVADIEIRDASLLIQGVFSTLRAGVSLKGPRKLPPPKLNAANSGLPAAAASLAAILSCRMSGNEAEDGRVGQCGA